MLRLIVIGLLLLVGCSDKTEFTQQSTSEFFLQDFNPQHLDVLWVVDNRSPMYRAKDHLVSEATRFFQRLDGITANYQMAMTSVDMEISKGGLKPDGNPTILKKNIGTVSERTQQFSSLVSQVINLKTGAQNRGFESALTALQSNFAIRAGIPLVIVFISDSDDHSTLPSGVTDAAAHYRDAFLKLKGDRSDLLRIFSINYQGSTPSDISRCATRYNADIDSAGFEDRFFKIAQLTGEATQVTADLCGPFADKIELAGLRLKTPVSTFALKQKPDPASLVVLITRDKETLNLKWSYDDTTQSLAFQDVPPEGSTVQVSYRVR